MQMTGYVLPDDLFGHATGSPNLARPAAMATTYVLASAADGTVEVDLYRGNVLTRAITGRSALLAPPGWPAPPTEPVG